MPADRCPFPPSRFLRDSDRVRLNRMYAGGGNAIRNLRTANDRTAAFRGFGLLHNWAPPTNNAAPDRNNVDSFIAAALAIIACPCCDTERVCHGRIWPAV